MNYEYIPRGEKVCILLHGYRQTYESMLSKFGQVFEKQDYTVLAVSAPFLVPEWSESKAVEGYSWYFFDPNKNEFIVKMDEAIQALKGLIDHLGLTERKKLVLGYSQGGYLAPFLGLELPNVDQVIGVSCRFRSEERQAPFPFQLDGIHGSADTAVEFKRSQSCFEDLKKLGQAGEYHVIDGEGHRLNSKFVKTVEKVLL